MITQVLSACESTRIPSRADRPNSYLGGAQSKLGQAISYAVNQRAKLEVYLGDGRIEIDNNLFENAIRPTKLGAQTWLSIGCCQADQRAATLYTIAENCRRLHIATGEYLEMS